MKQVLALTLSILLSIAVYAQPAKKPKQGSTAPSQADINKMMEDAMKADGMSKEEREEMKKMMGEAQKMMDTMKSKGMMPDGGLPAPVKIPPKKTAVLAKIPKLNDAGQYNAYIKQLLADCQLKLDKKIIADADVLFRQSQGKMASQANLAPEMFLQKKSEAAIYLCIKAANTYPANLVVQNNLAVVLHQTGYAHKAIPVLRYLLAQKNDPVLYNNLGQCFLSLGDTAQARLMFMSCLKADPDDLHSHTGIAAIEDAAGNTHAAEQHIRHVLKKGYSRIADELAKKNKMKFKPDDIKQPVPEYINPAKFKPVESAREIEHVLPVAEKREELNKMVQKAWAKYENYRQQHGAGTQKESLSQTLSMYGGYVGAITGKGGPLAAKAKLQFEQAVKDYQEFMLSATKESSGDIARGKAAYKQLDDNITAMYKTMSFESNAAACKKKFEYLLEYLRMTEVTRDNFISKTKYRLYEYVNQVVYWGAFLMNKDAYQEFFLGTVHDFLQRLSGYDELQQLYPTPQNTVFYCRQQKEDTAAKPKKDTLAIEPPDCPLKIEIPMGAAKAKIDCESWEIEGGELLQGSIERNFRTGEMTIFVGLGASFYEKGGIIKGIGGGVEAEAKAGVFVSFDREMNVMDCGDKAEASISGGIGPLMGEAKITGILGMESGGRLESDVLGQKNMIWKME